MCGRSRGRRGSGSNCCSQPRSPCAEFKGFAELRNLTRAVFVCNGSQSFAHGFMTLTELGDIRSLGKLEIARRQVDGAIRIFMRGGDPVVVSLLLAPASQILRDLNKGNPTSLSQAVSAVLQQEGVKPGEFRKEYNTKAGALKHGNRLDEQIDERALAARQSGKILFCICEYMRNPENVEMRHYTNYMRAYTLYYFRVERRMENGAATAGIINVMDRHIVIRLVEVRQQFLLCVLAVLKAIKAHLEKHRVRGDD